MPQNHRATDRAAKLVVKPAVRHIKGKPLGLTFFLCNKTIKQSNKPEVNIIERVITKERPTGQELARKLKTAAEAKCHKMAINKSQSVCHTPTGQPTGPPR